MNETVRIVNAISLYELTKLGDVSLEEAMKSWIPAHLFDVVQAFINSSISPSECVYIELPPL